jgi:hypothetical protein
VRRVVCCCEFGMAGDGPGAVVVLFRESPIT